MTSLPPIVGIGASAGGLEALKEFVHAIPNDSGIAYVVIQHLAPDQPSLMDKLLSAHTPVPVSRIEDGAIVRPDHIYIIPPGPFLELNGRQFKLLPHEREEGVRTPIDRFFTSLGEAAGRNAFAVVLSGTGSDGTMGVRAIKSQGGVALVQESRSARFPGMPDSAAETGLVDFVIRAGDMPGKILEIVRHRQHLERDGGREKLLESVEARMHEILERIETEAGNSFSGYKPGTLVRRVARRMVLLRQSTVDGYLKTLETSEGERQHLTQDFLIGVTQFFRDPEGFDVLEKSALAEILDSDQRNFRVWVPGCSSGEEAYSLAILITEMMETSGEQRAWKIFGTDIDLDALRHARTGRYADSSMKGLSKARRDRNFIFEDGYWHVDPKLREMCVFAPHNLLQDPPFSKLDLISCRNVMIYLNAESQEALLPRFHYALNPAGFLWLGPSESLGRSERYFESVDRAARLFRRNDRVAPGFSAITRVRSDPAEQRRIGSGLSVPEQFKRPRQVDVETQSEQLYLQRRASPFATVNRNDDVVYVSEAMTHLVKPPRGATSTSIDDYLAKELRLPVHAALGEARDTGSDAEVRNVVVDVRGEQKLVDIAVTALPDSELMLVALTEVRQRDMAALDPSEGSDVHHERELMLSRKRLSTLQREYEGAEQELRSANEELLSMNEELQSSNEELETSREELQSINEELETINSELSENNRQLSRANSDLKNLLESTDIATLFIDENDCVRLFTPAVVKLIGVQERDIGRPIHDLASRVNYPELQEDAERVRNSLQPVEREVRIDATDETFTTRVRPYRTLDNRIDGVVITFVDVTSRKRNERQLEENARVLKEQYAELETLYDTAPVGLNLLDRDLRYLRINNQLAEINGYSVEEHIGKLQEEMLPAAHREVFETQMRVLETGEPLLGLNVMTETPAAPGEQREFVVDYYPVKNSEEVFAIGSCVREVTRERRLERQVAESEARLRRIFDQAPVAITMSEGPDLVTSYSNARNQEEIGSREIVGLPLSEAMPELAGSELERRMREVYRTGNTSEVSQLEALVPHRRESGKRAIYRNVLEPWFGPEGTVTGVVSFSVDVTDQALAQERDQMHRERLQRLQDSLSSFVGLLDADGTLLEANATALERGGLVSEDVVGRKFWDCHWWSFSEESQERLKASVARAAAGESVRYDVPARMADGEMLIIDFQMVPIFDSQGLTVEIVPSAVDVTQRVRAEERKDMLLAELEHRVKNILATVQAIARFTARMAKSKEDMASSLTNRLAAISRTHDALTARDWSGQSLRALVEAEVAPYEADGLKRFSYQGDDVQLEPGKALSLGLALHELATNAAKYGAFSSSGGAVEFSVQAGESGFKRIEWREVGGPPVAKPEREGFGTFLIKRLLEAELDADIAIDYDRSGLRCEIRQRSG